MSHEPFGGLTGVGVRVAVIDSGVNPTHSHIVSVAGGVTIGEEIEPHMYLDLLGHGTAVMAAIQEKAPAAQYYAVRVFCSALRTRIEHLLSAIEWCLDHDIHVINLSLGTLNAAHAARFQPLIQRAVASGTSLVSASNVDGCPAFPGALDGVIGVGLDWDCPRNSYRYEQGEDRLEFRASGYPRSLPGVAPQRNLRGISFAVANMAGFAVRARESLGGTGDLAAALTAEADRLTAQPEP